LLPTYTIVFPLTSHVHVVVISGRRSLFARRWQRVIERRRVEILFFFLRSLGFFCATELGHGKHARTHTHTLHTYTCTRTYTHAKNRYCSRYWSRFSRRHTHRPWQPLERPHPPPIPNLVTFFYKIKICWEIFGICFLLAHPRPPQHTLV
jgi:hypothetical protein